MNRRMLPLTAGLVLTGSLLGSLLTAPLAAAAPLPAGASFVSDDFASGVLDPSVWTEVDPVGDGTVAFPGAGTSNARLSLSVPAGTNHDVWGTNRSLRVTQPVADQDFTVQARFLSVPAQKFQTQGIVVEQDASNWLRFDVHSTGTTLRVFAAKTVNGASSQLLLHTVTPGTIGSEIQLRVARGGDSWTLAYSADGLSWTTAGAATHALQANRIGPFASNGSPFPAFTAEVDWFFDMASPVTPEDGETATIHTLSTPVVGQGSVTRSPNQASYPEGTVVTLTAVPAAGWSFTGWSGAVTSSNPTVTTTMSGPRTVTATFTEDSSGPGPTDPSFVSDDFASGLLNPSVWTVTDPVGDGTVGFPGAGTDDARLSLSVPGGTNHDVWGTNRSLRVTQPVTDQDFAAQVRFRSVPAQKYQTQGIVVEQDASNWLRFDVHSTGGSLRVFAAKTVNGASSQLLQKTVTAGTQILLQVTRSGNAWTLAYSTNGSTWTTAGSVNHAMTANRIGPFASNGSPFPAFTADVDWFFDTASPIDPEDADTATIHQLNTPVVGAGSVVRSPNQASYPAGTVVTLTAVPADGWTFAGWTGAVTSGNPTISTTMTGPRTITATFEQDTPPAGSHPLTVNVIGQGQVTRSPSATSYPEGTEVTLTAQPASGWIFVGWSGDASGTTPTKQVTMSEPRSVTATFQQSSPNPPTVDIWYGDDQTFGANGRSQKWVNVLGNARDANGIQSVTYQLNGGPAKNLSLGPDLRRLYGSGDFNVQIPYTSLANGTNTVAITATDTTGASRTRSVTVRKDIEVPTLPYTASWSSSSNPNVVAQVNDGKWSSGASGLTILEPGYDRTVAIGHAGWSDYEVTVPVTVRGLTPGYGTPQSGAPLVGLGLHWDGHTPRNTEEPAIDWYPTGAFAWFRWQQSGRFELLGNGDSPLVRDSESWNFGTTYVMKARAESVSGGVQYSYKWWPQGSVEPAGWNLTLVEDSGPENGAVLLIAHHVDATFGAVEVTPL